MVLKGERILLRKFKKEDAQEYLEIASEDTIKQYLPYASPDTLVESIDLIDNYSQVDFVNDFFYVIEDIKTHRIISSLQCYRTLTFTLDVSYFIGEDFRGNEFVLEALKIFIDYIFKNTSYSTLIFMIDDSNHSSKRIMKKLNAEVFQYSKTSSYYSYQIKSAK